MFSIRAVILDHYMSDRIDELYVDEPSSDLNQFQEPVLRIFGSTTDGFKSCVHVHGVYPYVYVPYKGGENPDRDCLLVGAALDEALAKANDNGKNYRYVFKVIPILKIPLYGYHSKHKQFFQIFFCNPYYIRKAMELLMSGAILGQKFQPYEAHIPYALQFMIDYNIYGMSFVTFSKVKYRKNPENPGSLVSIKTESIFSNKVKKITSCYFEVDALAQDILNKNNKNVVSANPGLEAIWKEEKIRRRNANKPSQVGISSTASRPHMDMCASEIMYKEKLAKKLREIPFEKPEVTVSRTEPEFLYLSEIPESSSLPEGSVSSKYIESTKTENRVSEMIDENILSHLVFSKKECRGSESEEEGEEREGRIEADSILGRNHNEEEEAEFEDDVGGDMTQPLDMEENTMYESDANRGEHGQNSAGTEDNFWKIMADRLFQFDGGQDSSSESDPEAAYRTLPRLSNSQVSVDTMLACCSPDIESMSNWSNNIMSILTEDDACISPTISQSPQTVWSNYSTKMDSSWLYDNSQEPWTCNKNETVFEDCFSLKQKPDNICDFAVGAAEELSKKKSPNEVYGNLFGSDQIDFSEHPFENISSIYPMSPLLSVINSSENLENNSETSVHYSCKRVNDTLKSFSPPNEKMSTSISKNLEKEMKTVAVRKDHKSDKINQDKFLDVLNKFSSINRKENEEDDIEKRKPLTLKQYIQDCEEIVNIDFKNLSDREMVIIEYKPLNGRSTENKFLIKPLDKFLRNWNSAEKKVNNRLVNSEKPEDRWPKTVNKMKDLVMSKSSKEKNNLCGLVNSLEHKYGGDWLEPIKINSIKNKLVVKSMEVSPNNDDEKTYKVNENVISQGKIKMKLTKSAGKDLNKTSAYREKPSNYVKYNEFRDADNDVNANHISMYTCRNYLDGGSNKLKKAGEEKKSDETFQCNGEKINIIELEEVRRKKKKKEVIKRKGTDVGDRFPKKLRKSQRTLNMTDSDSKIINKINSCFEKYYKNIIKVNNFHNENDNNYYFQDSEEELEDDTKKFINSVMGKQGKNDLNFSNLDPVKFVTRLLSSFSHMAQSSEIPPLSITISLGNVRNTSTTPIPIQLNLQPTLNVPTKFVKYSNKKHKRKVNFQNVDGPADSSSEDSGDSKSESSLKTTKKDGFYKPLKLISHSSGFVKNGRKGKTRSRFTNKKNSEIIKKTSSSLEVCSIHFSKNSECSSTLNEKSFERDPTFQEKGKLSRDSINTKKYLRKVRQRPLATKNRHTHLSQNSSDSEPEPDFIYESDKESHSKRKNEKAGRRMSKNYLDRIPQVDVCLSTSEDEEVEIRFKNLIHVNTSTDPFTVVSVAERKWQDSERMEVPDSNEFEVNKLSTGRIAGWEAEDVTASSKTREDTQDELAAKLPNSEVLSGMLVSSLCRFSSKSSTPQNFEASNDVMTPKNQKPFTSEMSTPSGLNYLSEKSENSWKICQKVFFKSAKVIPALLQTETNNLIRGTNRTPQPSSLIVDGEFELSSRNLPIVSSASGAQVTPLSSNGKPMTEPLGQSTQDVLSSKGSSGRESNSSKLPVNSGNTIFSQSSCLSSSEALNVSFFNTPSVTSIRGIKVIVPRKKPPKGNEVLSVLHETELLPSWDELPFYSDPRDRFRVMETGPKILKIESSSIVELKTFKSSLNLLGTEERRENILNYQMQGCRGTRHLFVTDISIRIIPLRKPPASSNVIKWLNFKNKQKNLDNKLESSKRKIVVPLSSDNGSELEEEMDLSMTLSVQDKTSSSIKFNSSENCLRNSSNNCPVFKDTPRRNLDIKSLSGGVGGEPKVDLKKGPLSKIKGMKRLLFQKNLKKSDVEDSSLIGCEKTSEKTFSKNSKQSSEHSFQIRGITLNNTFGFDSSVENMQDLKLGPTHQNMSMLVIEVHVSSRKDLRPDPRHDPIRALFYTANFDDSEQKQETGIIVVGNKGILTDVGITVKTVHHVPTESELIRKTIELTRAWDPDILAGYEIEMNSWGYLIQRSFVLEKNLLHLLGRVQTGQSEGASSKDTADFLGEPDEYYETPKNVRQMKITGRIVLDVWRVLRHEIALTSYTFENVMYHLSHERHPVFSHETLSFYWEHQSHRFRHITVEYYLTRVLGVVKLLDQLDFTNRTSELSRLFGIQFYEVLSRGSQFRVESMMLRLAKPLDYIPVSPSVAQRAAMRAPASLPLILEPESKFYADPIIVLDFQSLYPSMIIAYNYCFSTCLGRVENLGSREPFEFGCTQLQISPEELKLLEKDITISPAGVAFVKSTIRRGVLPVMLEEILQTRLMVKKSMRENKGHKTLEKLLFARQLGLKLIANVTYGYTAANFSGRMPCIEVGDSVVSKGRETLHRAIQLVKNTPKWGAKVVYGDTDSIFVLTPGKSRQEAFQIGAEIAEVVTQNNPKPVKLKLEKVYQPSILQTKKRYVGYMYESPEQAKPIFEAKGIETVRRDGCPAVGKILQKALQILFDTRDVSLVKKYTIRQFGKLFQGRVNMQDLIFAKEYRGRKGYRPGACVPALQLAKEWTERDKRAEPRVKERVPYVIVNGPPGVPLIQCVRSPRDLISDPSLTISPVYYITKAIIPPMQRCFSLIGVDVMSWYLEMPRKYHKSYKVNHAEGQRRNTISQYFSTAECIVCSEVTNTQICQECHKQSQILAVTLTEKIRRWERCHANTLRICQSCCGRPTELECQSLDCPVFFRRNRVSRDLDQALFLREVIHHYF